MARIGRAPGPVVATVAPTLCGNAAQSGRIEGKFARGNACPTALGTEAAATVATIGAIGGKLKLGGAGMNSSAKLELDAISSFGNGRGRSSNSTDAKPGGGVGGALSWASRSRATPALPPSG